MYHRVQREVIPMLQRLIPPHFSSWMFIPLLMVGCGGPLESDHAAASPPKAARAPQAPAVDFRPAPSSLPGSDHELIVRGGGARPRVARSGPPGGVTFPAGRT